MRIARKILILLTVFVWVNVKAQPSFFKNLGNGINKKTQCACVSEAGNLTLGYYNIAKDSLIFISWNSVSKLWENLNTVKSDGSLNDYTSKCIYKKDSLILFTKYKDNSVSKSGLFYINKTAVSKIADLSTDIAENPVTDLKIYNNTLVVLGNYDSIGLGVNKIKSSNASVYDGLQWKSLNFNLNQNIYKFQNLPSTIFNDTLLLLTANSGILKMLFKPLYTWFPITFNPPIKSEITSITSTGYNWLITPKDADTMLLFSGESVTYKHYKNRLNSSINVIKSNTGIYISENGLNGRLLKMDTSTNTFIPLYISSGIDSVPNILLTNNSSSHIYYLTWNTILYENNNWGTIAEIDNTKEKPINSDTISIFVYNDLNGNFIKDAGESLTNTASIIELNSKRILKTQNGFYKDIVPNYNNLEYQITGIEGPECFKVPFTGGLKTKNTLTNVAHDSLFFPIKLITVSNISVKSSAKACARLTDTVTLNININVEDCSLNNFTTDVKIDLASGTILVNSTPPFVSQNGTEYNFILQNLNSLNSGNIQLKVVYPFEKFSLGQLVKHKVSINNSIADDPADNSDSIIQKIVYSYDPNAKHCVPSGNIKGGLKTIRYYIDFQNEGNSEARRVMVIDTLEAKIPVYEFRMISCSHPFTVSLTNNVVTWIFDNINLPAKSVDEKASQGYIIFEARLKNELPVGDSIRNKAYIYFDYNYPVETNTALVVRGIDDPEEYPEEISGKNGLKIYPNPSKSVVNFKNRLDVTQEVKIYNTLGQEVFDFKLETLENLIKPVEDWPQGMYFVRSSMGSHYKLLIQ